MILGYSNVPVAITPAKPASTRLVVLVATMLLVLEYSIAVLIFVHVELVTTTLAYRCVLSVMPAV